LTVLAQLAAQEAVEVAVAEVLSKQVLAMAMAEHVQLHLAHKSGFTLDKVE
jgi:hypothetical protein